ncbi:MAG: hypothetical protein GXO14_06065 [Thermococci archaeon]|nr:hypothetical protein [Thermococci archaeon]
MLRREETKRARRAQISLEFMLIIALGMILLLYSVNSVTFKSGTSGQTTLQINVGLEEKSLASAISSTISQVYAQGPGAKATTYVHLIYLRNAKYLERALGTASTPEVLITYGEYLGKGNGTMVCVGIPNSTLIINQTNRTVFWSYSLYQKSLYDNQSIWSPQGSLTLRYTNTSPEFTVYGIALKPSDLPGNLKVVVTWDPGEGNVWSYTNGTLSININPGG